MMMIKTLRSKIGVKRVEKEEKMWLLFHTNLAWDVLFFFLGFAAKK
jgi:hypothetical protein